MNLRWLGKLILLPVILIGILIVIKSLDYYTPDFTSGFLIGKENLFNSPYKYAFYTHIIASPIALLIGIIQLIPKRKNNKAHRHLGRIYTFLILFFIATSGVIMSFFAFGGALSISSFLLLSILLFLFTYKGYKAAISGKTFLHKINMTRSFLLLLSAITLRILSYIFNHYYNWHGETAYNVTAWLSWLPILLIYEVQLLLKTKKINF